MIKSLNMSPRDFANPLKAEDNADAVWMVEQVAKGNYGFPSQVAQTIVDRAPSNALNWSYGISEKQAYVIAGAAIAHGHVPNTPLYSKDFHAKVDAKEAAKKSAQQQKWESYSKTYTKSSTKVAVGSRVFDAKKGWGTIGSIITKSSGYVTVNYDSGGSGKAMAFNLKGVDGNPLKKRPK